MVNAFMNTCFSYTSGFSLGSLFTHGGGDKVLMGGGGTHEGEHRLYGGPNFERLYHKLKVVLLMLSFNFTMQYIGTILLKLVDLYTYLIAFKFA